MPEAEALHLEIGCGKGKFTAEMAALHPKVLFLAVERVREALVLAMEKAVNMGLKNADGSVRDVYTNEELEEHPDIWAVIHGRLAEFGFILRYPEGKTHITGYQYEPWHIRYLDSAAAAADIMGRPGLTLEEWLAEKGSK